MLEIPWQKAPCAGEMAQQLKALGRQTSHPKLNSPETMERKAERIEHPTKPCPLTPIYVPEHVYFLPTINTPNNKNEAQPCARDRLSQHGFKVISSTALQTSTFVSQWPVKANSFLFMLRKI